MSGAWHISHNAINISLNVGSTRGQINVEKPSLPAPTHQQKRGCWQGTGGTYRFACSSHCINPFEHHEGVLLSVCALRPRAGRGRRRHNSVITTLTASAARCSVAILGQGALESSWNGMPYFQTPALLLPVWSGVPFHALHKVHVHCFHPSALHEGVMSRRLNPNLKHPITGRHRQLDFYVETAVAVAFCAKCSLAALC